MEIDVFTNLITTVGFPIACVIGLGFFIFTAYKDCTKKNEAREEKLYKMISDNQQLNKELTATNASFAKTLDAFADDIEDIKVTVNEIKETLH